MAFGLVFGKKDSARPCDCMIYGFPKETPKLTKKILRETLSNVHSIIGENLVGIYLYGSLAMGCFKLKSSDVDVILITEKRLEKEEGKRIIEYLKETCSKERRIEMSIIGLATVRKPRYPMLVDLHYEYWGDVFENKKDSEILSNLYTIKERGFRVWGRPISDVFSRIPALYHLRSVIEDIRNTREYLHEKSEGIGYNVAVYWILSSCRILAFIREEKVLSKLEGDQWGLANLPKKYHKLIEQALSYYEGEKKKALIGPRGELDEFADYVTEAILRENKL